MPRSRARHSTPQVGVGGQEHLGVRPRPEAVSPCRELGAELPEVVDLPVADDPDPRVVGRHRLPRRVGQIHDGQAPVREPHRALGPDPRAVRAAVGEEIAHAAEDLRVDGRPGAEVQSARYAAHARLRRRPVPVSGAPPAGSGTSAPCAPTRPRRPSARGSRTPVRPAPCRPSGAAAHPASSRPT